MSTPVIQDNHGGLDLDHDYSYINNGDYADAVGIRAESREGRTAGTNEIIVGNEFAESLGTITASDKVYLLSNISAPNIYQLELFDGNGFFIGGTVTFNTIAQAQTAINTVIATVGISAQYTNTSASSFTMRLYSTLATGWEYSIKSTGTDTFTFVNIVEAIPDSMEGELETIGSFDLLGDLFDWSTTNNTPASTDPIAVTGVDFSVPIQVAHDLTDIFQTGMYVDIVGVNGVPNANGRFLIEVVDNQYFNIIGTDGSLYTYIDGGIITIANVGVGAISVGQKDLSLPQWTITRLLQSKELNFSVYSPIDCDCEADNFRKSLYFTDDRNAPRVLYYRGGYDADGFLNFQNPLNDYTYGTINEQARLQAILRNTHITYVSQNIGGGSLLAGNYRYAIRGVTDSLSGTDWTPLSNPVNVYKADPSIPLKILGDQTDIATSKSNALQITGDSLDIFKYIEVAYIHYTNNSFDGAIFKRILVSQGQTSIDLLHSGNESDQQNLDIGTLNSLPTIYANARNIRIIDNRLVLSNLESVSNIDFTSFTEAITYSLDKKTIAGVGDASLGTFEYGEYQNPDNVFNNIGYMLNETYRLGYIYKLKNGSVTQPFYPGYDITINCDPTAIGRTAGLTDFDLNDGSGNVLIPYIVSEFPDLSTLVDGVPFNQLVEEIIVVRAEVENPTILYSGLMILGISGSVSYLPGGLNNDNWMFYTPSNDSPSASDIRFGEHPFDMNYAGLEIIDPARFPLSGSYPFTSTATSMSAQRRYAGLYSSDVLFGQVTPSALAGDKILNFGQAVPYNAADITTPTAALLKVWQRDLVTLYYWNTTRDFASPPQEVDVDEMQIIDRLEEKTFSATGDIFSKRLMYFTENRTPFVSVGYKEDLFSEKSPVVYVSANLTKQTAATDSGLYLMQYYRPVTDQYGLASNNSFIPTGAYFVVTEDATVTGQTLDVFGGDTFTQKQYLKHRTPYRGTSLNATNEPNEDPASSDDTTAWYLSLRGGGGGIEYYGQTRMNAQMKYYNPDDGQEPYPATSVDPLIPETSSTEQWLSRTTGDTFQYDNGYSTRNDINSYRGFDSNLLTSTDFPARIAWSDVKAQGSAQDNYRVFLPLNYKDLDLTFGEITHMENLNGRLVTLQPRKYMSQFFNTSAILTSTDGSEVITGDGAVMGRRGATLTTYGTTHKWSCVKGRSQGGNDVLFWIDTEKFMILRYGSDGAVPIGATKNIESFLGNNLQWTITQLIPTSGQGISSVWNQRYSEAIWTVRAKRTVSEWASDAIYEVGDVVAFTPAVFTTAQETGEFYTCLIDTTSGQSPDTNPLSWQVIPHTNTEYYNEFTLVWSEKKAKFICFLPILPKIYLQWLDTYLTPNPVNNLSDRLYEHDQGTYCEWYDGLVVQDAYVQSVINAQPEIGKTAEAVRYATKIVPKRVEFTTPTQESFLIDTDFTDVENVFNAPVQNDSTGTGVNTGDTSRLYGRYILAKIFMQHGVYQHIRNVIMKVRIRARTYNR